MSTHPTCDTCKNPVWRDVSDEWHHHSGHQGTTGHEVTVRAWAGLQTFGDQPEGES